MASGATDRHNLSWSIGYNYQETVAFAHLTLGGVFGDFPGLRVVITHGGGFVPYQAGRIQAARLRPPDVRAKRSIYDYQENIHYEILVHDLAARELLVDFAGVDPLTTS